MVSSHVKTSSVEDSSEDELRLVDAVLAAFSFQSRNCKLPELLNVQGVYKAFAKLHEKYPAWLQDMRFTYGPKGTVPVSGALEDILFDLGASGIMAVENPWYKFLKIPSPKLEIIRRAISQRRNETEQNELKRLADEFSLLYNEATKEE